MPNNKGQTWAAVIAEALPTKARRGDVRAIAELANRIEGRPAQAIAVDLDAGEGLAEEIAKARKRAGHAKDRQADQAWCGAT